MWEKEKSRLISMSNFFPTMSGEFLIIKFHGSYRLLKHKFRAFSGPFQGHYG